MLSFNIMRLDCGCDSEFQCGCLNSASEWVGSEIALVGNAVARRNVGEQFPPVPGDTDEGFGLIRGCGRFVGGVFDPNTGLDPVPVVL